MTMFTRKSRVFVAAAIPALVCLSISSAGANAPTSAHVRIHNAFKAGLIADALALGGHYEYDAVKIKSRGGFENFAPPGKDNHGVGWGTANYHPGKTAGDMTDAGDVALMLLRHLAELKRSNALPSYSFDSFAAYWKKQIDNGYLTSFPSSNPPLFCIELTLSGTALATSRPLLRVPPVPAAPNPVTSTAARAGPCRRCSSSPTPQDHSASALQPT
jgi:hypothetical protein